MTFWHAELVRWDGWRRKYGPRKGNLDLCSTVVFQGYGAGSLTSWQPLLLASVLSVGSLGEHKCKHIINLFKVFVLDHNRGSIPLLIFLSFYFQQRALNTNSEKITWLEYLLMTRLFLTNVLYIHTKYKVHCINNY